MCDYHLKHGNRDGILLDRYRNWRERGLVNIID